MEKTLERFREHCGTKENTLVTSIFSASYNVFQAFIDNLITVKPVFRDHTYNKIGRLHQVVPKCRFYWVDLRTGVISEQSSLKAVDCLIKVVLNTGLTYN